MSIASLSIRRPIFITSLVLLLIITGFFSLTRLGVDLFPDVTFPFVVVNTVYNGAGPEEVENLISRPLEEELSSIQGLKRLTSRSQEGFSVVFAEFVLSTDIKYAEQQVRNKVARAKRILPDDIDDPLVIRFDPADQPVIRYALFAKLPPAALYELAKEKIKPRLEQVADVGSVTLIGGVKREIQVEIDRNKLNAQQLSAVGIGQTLKNYGLNVPVGKNDQGASETSFRTIGQFDSLRQIEEVGVSFGGEIGNSTTLKNVATVRDGTEDPQTICELWAPIGEEQPHGMFAKKIDNQSIKRENNGALFIDVYKQSGSNTVSVADLTREKVAKLNEMLAGQEGSPRLVMVRDGSRWIRANVEDVGFAIVFGILLTVIVVYLFLGNLRSTIITGLALPNSLLGSFILMYIMGFTVNVMTLLALSLAIGLLIDDAIVVRENIFRKMEEGMHPVQAAEEGTSEVTLAVVATTATVLAVFFPIGFLSGIVGQFFKQFGLTVCFAMIISLFDALTIAPMLSAYFAGKTHGKPNLVVRAFRRFQDGLDHQYERIMHLGLRRPWAVLAVTTVIVIGSFATLGAVKKTFLPPNDQGEFMVSVQLPPGTALSGTYDAAVKIRENLMKIPEMNLLAMVVGNTEGESNVANIGVALTHYTQRNRRTQVIQEEIRGMLKQYADWKPSVNEYSAVGGVQYPFNLNIMGDDLSQLQPYAQQVVDRLKKIPDLTDVSMDYRSGKPEFRIEFDPLRMQTVGVTPVIAGAELRYHIAGEVVGKLRERGYEYDIRMRLKPDQRNLRSAYAQTRVPNSQFKMIPLSAIAKGKEALGPEKIIRQDRSRVIQIHANLAPKGAISSATDTAKNFLTKELPQPAGTSFVFWGQSEDFRELGINMMIAFGFALVFIYLVLASLYESFITPITILIAIPPAMSGAFLALFLFGEMLNLFSMIGLILLMGLVTKNSILLVDYALEGIRAGLSRDEAILRAGRARLRPILMTSLAMIAGTMPIALGIGEAAKSRTAMGIGIIGGIIVSTVLTLVVLPAAFGYIDRFREWLEARFRPDDMVGLEPEHNIMQEAIRRKKK
ncbi:MAG: efflux RND transporter permease subunit [Spirochaetia bacterium]|nr:efflux RND transporter permease subunit [Spirochaetia bacterium]